MCGASPVEVGRCPEPTRPRATSLALTIRLAGGLVVGAIVALLVFGPPHTWNDWLALCLLLAAGMAAATRSDRVDRLVDRLLSHRIDRSSALLALFVGWILGVNLALWLLPDASGWLRVLVALACGLALSPLLYAVRRWFRRRDDRTDG